MRKSIISSMLILLLFNFCLSFSNVYASDILTVDDFNDIPSTHWGLEAISWGLEKKMLTGYPDNMFKPDNNVTECEFAVILFKYAENASTENIVALEGKHWSQPYYNELEQFELPFGGYEDDIIKSSPITRGKIATIISAMYGFNLATEEQAVYWLYENELSKGTNENLRTFESYEPNQPLTRTQAIQFLLNLNTIEIKEMTFKGRPSIKGMQKYNQEILGIDGVPTETENVNFADFGMLPTVGSGITTKVVNGKVVVEMNKITTPTKVDGIKSNVMNYFDFDANSSFNAGEMNNSIAKYKGVELPMNKNFSTAEYMNDGGLVTTELDNSESKIGSFTDKEVFKALLPNLSSFQASQAQINKAKEMVDTWYGKKGTKNTIYLTVDSKSKGSSMVIIYGSGDVKIMMFNKTGVLSTMGEYITVE